MTCFDLKNKWSFITGAAGLLGKEHAFALAEINSNLILTDINMNGLLKLKEEITKSHQVLIECFVLDVSKEESIVDVLKQIESKNIAIDVLVNNAAIDPKFEKDSMVNSSRLENFSLLDWNRQLEVGLTGAFLCSKHIVKHMHENKIQGTILNIASDLGVIAPDQRLYRQEGIPADKQNVKPVTYSVIKFGLIGLTKYLATYWADEGIRANSLSPGGVFNNHGEEFVNRISSLIPMKRMAEKNEYRGCVQFLCSPASSYINGHNLIADGGRSVW